MIRKIVFIVLKKNNCFGGINKGNNYIKEKNRSFEISKLRVFCDYYCALMFNCIIYFTGFTNIHSTQVLQISVCIFEHIYSIPLDLYKQKKHTQPYLY